MLGHYFPTRRFLPLDGCSNLVTFLFIPTVDVCFYEFVGTTETVKSSVRNLGRYWKLFVFSHFNVSEIG